jgi:hypothetical protein
MVIFWSLFFAGSEIGSVVDTLSSEFCDEEKKVKY